MFQLYSMQSRYKLTLFLSFYAPILFQVFSLSLKDFMEILYMLSIHKLAQHKRLCCGNQFSIDLAPSENSKSQLALKGTLHNC